MTRNAELSPSRVVKQAGPGPFVTFGVIEGEGGRQHVWSSRHHRKSLAVVTRRAEKSRSSVLLRCLWMPSDVNWWIGIVFALGSLLFGTASLLSLFPDLAAIWEMGPETINPIYFAGSIPFTTAAFLQLRQAAKAAEQQLVSSLPVTRRSWLGRRFSDIGWLSCLLQFIGTLLFNLNTFDAMQPGLTWFQQDLAVWIPNVVGSVLFFGSGYLAFIETCHAFWDWPRGRISWWVVFVNLLGCVGFLVSSLFAIVLPSGPNIDMTTMANAATLLGAVSFLLGSLLMLPEAATTPHEA